MASIAEIIKREESTDDMIVLYKEGLFVRAYQKSAFLILQRGIHLKVLKKHIKVVNQNVVSVGFPETSLSKHFEEDEIVTESDKILMIKSKPVNTDDYKKWFDSIELMVAATVETGNRIPAGIKEEELRVLARLKEFRLEESTPMDCMVFLASIRKELSI